MVLPGVGDKRGVQARRGQIGFAAGKTLRPCPRGRIPFPDVGQGIAGTHVPTTDQNGHTPARVVRHGVAVARARRGPRDCAIGPVLLRRIPFPCVLLGDATETGLRQLHSAEQDGDVAFAVPDQRGSESGAGRAQGRKLGPLALRGIPLPRVARRDGELGEPIGCAAPEEQHLSGGFLEDHCLLAAIAWPLARVAALGEGAGCGIPFPKVRVVDDVVAAGQHAPAIDNEIVTNRVKNHACARARARFVAGRGAVGPDAGRGIPLPQILKCRHNGIVGRGPAAEHGQDPAGLVKGGRRQITPVWARHRGTDARPGGFLGRGHRAQSRVRGLHAGVTGPARMVFVAGGEQDESSQHTSSELHDGSPTVGQHTIAAQRGAARTRPDETQQCRKNFIRRFTDTSPKERSSLGLRLPSFQ